MQLSDQRDAVIELVKLLTWIIEIFFKRCANVERQPRDCMLEAAEFLIQTLPLGAD
jgi:hypothetical protein